ncbi:MULTISPECIES: uracil-DNA glycosylase [unclassified Variovorax]|uniref:uracil-DNA glycosylase n=1 Tax=unclassified Variovorax TaxID=663243 RepID=UPI0013182609|nr:MULTISPECIES: uracil-DNA glycosylase [unclassified Variovorax]VTU42665.1 uracil-DNA glycosylase, family 4 [Variovorax sp. PBL-H6]VTU43766.1 uracil-DNA glycosylase, family 4 [Variovorax sp. SRS16]VTU43834.1 uracil-DNA glycosylase, family 4 [Variovorax sp. PBL-E5]
MTTPLQFVESLRALPAFPDVFNPWRDHDPVNDQNELGPSIRAANLERYLAARVGKARLLLVAEAPGHRGCRVSGIAMTSERIMLGHHPVIPHHAVFEGPKQQTSLPELHKKGANEQTASTVWGLLLSLGLAPEEFVLWNAFPCHPHKPGEPLSNRAPTPKEVAACADVLRDMLTLLGTARVVAVGRVAQRQLQVQGVEAPYVRHPAMAGINQFREQVQALASSFR